MLILLAQELYFTPQGQAPGFPSLSQGLPSTNLVYVLGFLNHNSDIVIIPMVFLLLFILGFTAMWRTTRKPVPPAPAVPDQERTYKVLRCDELVALVHAIDVSFDIADGDTFPRLNFLGPEIGERKKERATVALILWEEGFRLESVAKEAD